MGRPYSRVVSAKTPRVRCCCRVAGPFKSRHTALLFRDDALEALGDNIAEIEDVACKRMLEGRFQKRWGWVIEDELGQAYRHANGKARRTEGA